MDPIKLNPAGRVLTEVKEGTKNGDAGSVSTMADAFLNIFKDKLEGVNTKLKTSEDMDLKLAAGDAESIHDVMIAAQKAQTALNMTITIRNLLLKTYQELLRMQ